MRIIGYGNIERGDDGVGIIAAERLRDLGFAAVTCTGDGLELLEAWRDQNHVIIIDTVVTGAPAGTLHRWDDCQSLPASLAPTSTHGLGLAQAIDLAGTLDLLPARVSVWGVEGKNFAAGSEISPEVQSAIGELVELVVAEISKTVPVGSSSQSDQ